MEEKMKVYEIKELLNAELHTGENLLDREIIGAYASDLMSDVLASTYLNESAVLVSGLNNVQLIRTAEMLDLVVIVLVRGKKPHPEIVKMAEENGMALMTTTLNMYNSCGMLYAHGMRGCSNERVN
jgi:predicted transcriptional regulator